MKGENDLMQKQDKLDHVKQWLADNPSIKRGRRKAYMQATGKEISLSHFQRALRGINSEWQPDSKSARVKQWLKDVDFDFSWGEDGFEWRKVNRKELYTKFKEEMGVEISISQFREVIRVMLAEEKQQQLKDKTDFDEYIAEKEAESLEEEDLDEDEDWGEDSEGDVVEKPPMTQVIVQWVRRKGDQIKGKSVKSLCAEFKKEEGVQVSDPLFGYATRSIRKEKGMLKPRPVKIKTKRAVKRRRRGPSIQSIKRDEARRDEAKEKRMMELEKENEYLRWCLEGEHKGFVNQLLEELS